MKPRITMVTLGVENLERALAFYRDGLGWPTNGIVGSGDGEVAFFDLKGGLKLALWRRQSIAKDAGVAPQPPSATELTLAHNMPSKEGVDLVMGRPGGPGPRSSSRRRTHSGVGTQATSRIPTATCGKSPGTPLGRQKKRSKRG